MFFTFQQISASSSSEIKVFVAFIYLIIRLSTDVKNERSINGALTVDILFPSILGIGAFMADRYLNFSFTIAALLLFLLRFGFENQESLRYLNRHEHWVLFAVGGLLFALAAYAYIAFEIKPPRDIMWASGILASTGFIALIAALWRLAQHQAAKYKAENKAATSLVVRKKEGRLMLNF